MTRRLELKAIPWQSIIAPTDSTDYVLLAIGLRHCAERNRGKVLDFNDIFYCEKLAINQGKAIIRTIA